MLRPALNQEFCHDLFKLRHNADQLRRASSGWDVTLPTKPRGVPQPSGPSLDSHKPPSN